MKKTLFAALALAFVASCSNEEVVEMAQKEAIGFDKAFVNNSTRSAVDPSYSSAENGRMFTNFAVYGFVEGAALFDGVEVSKNITNNELDDTDWDYEGTHYWIAGAKYNFAAVAPINESVWEKTDATKDAVTLSFTNAGTEDVLFAQTAEIEGQASGNSLVAFNFRHILSKVKFSFENAYNASNATIKVKDIKITNAYNTADVILTGETNWSNQDGTLVLNFGHATDDNATSNEAKAYAYNTTLESYNELFIIPGKVTNNYNVTFTVELYIGTEANPVKTYAHTATVDFEPVPGNAYDIKAVINPENIDPEHKQEPIQFTVNQLSGWGETNNVEAK